MEMDKTEKKSTKTDYLVAFHQGQIDMLLKRSEGHADKRPLKAKIKEVALEVAEFSLAPGVSSIVRHTNQISVKLTWLFCHLCFLGVLGYLVANNIMNYLHYEVNTQVNIINQVPFDFPTITLCNINFFQSNYSIDFLIEMSTFYNFTNPFNFTDLRSNIYYGDLSDYRAVGLEYVIVKNLSQTEIQKLAYPLDQTLFSCNFNFQPCDYTFFDWYFHPEYGNCYQFKTEIPIVKTGITAGLEIEMFVVIPVYLQALTKALGLAVFIHSQTTSPLSIEPVLVSPNQQSNIVFSKVITEKQPKPYSDCQENIDTPLKSLLLNQGISYNQLDCIAQCYQEIVIKTCMCYDSSVVNFHSGYLPCISDNCVNTVAIIFLNNNYIENFCLPECPLECSTTTYTKSISTNGYPTAYYETELWNTTNVSAIFNDSYFTMPLRDHILALNVYVESLSYTYIVETPAMDIITLISNLGGSVGIMLGMSCATAAELVELGVKILIVFLEHYKSKRQNRKLANASIDTPPAIDT